VADFLGHRVEFIIISLIIIVEPYTVLCSAEVFIRSLICR